MGIAHGRFPVDLTCVQDILGTNMRRIMNHTVFGISNKIILRPGSNVELYMCRT